MELMNRKRLAVIVVSVFLVLGCSTRYQAHKQGVSQEQSNIDNYECTRDSTHQAFGMYNGMALGGSELNIGLWYKCMAARGYTVTEI